MGHGIDWIQFAFRDLEGDLTQLREAGRAMGPWRRVLGTSSLSLRCALHETPKNRVLFVDENTTMLPLAATGFAEAWAKEVIRDLGIVGHSSPTISRLDLATDVSFADMHDAARTMEALSAVQASRHKMQVFYARGSKRIETIYWLTDDGVTLRIYDKTAEAAGQDGAGQMIRFEHQHRPRAAEQRTLAELRRVDLSQKATAPLRVGNRGNLVVSNLNAMHACLKNMRDAGQIKSDTIAERLLGTLVRARVAGSEAWSSPRTATERRRELRDLGLALHPDLAVPVDLGPLLRAVTAAWRPSP